jgi:hypothetical protein
LFSIRCSTFSTVLSLTLFPTFFKPRLRIRLCTCK